jgi:hypothetical protein
VTPHTRPIRLVLSPADGRVEVFLLPRSQQSPECNPKCTAAATAKGQGCYIIASGVGVDGDGRLFGLPAVIAVGNLNQK